MSYVLWRHNSVFNNVCRRYLKLAMVKDQEYFVLHLSLLSNNNLMILYFPINYNYLYNYWPTISLLILFSMGVTFGNRKHSRVGGGTLYGRKVNTAKRVGEKVNVMSEHNIPPATPKGSTCLYQFYIMGSSNPK